MKLLLDQNVSYRLVKKIGFQFPGTQQTKEAGLNNKSDKQVWEFAKNGGFTIVTFDSDFYDLSLTQGHPPKIIWIKSGNLTTSNLEKLLLDKAVQIQIFVDDEELSCLEIVG